MFRRPRESARERARAGTQSHAFRSSGLKLLDARFRGQGETWDMAARRGLQRLTQGEVEALAAEGGVVAVLQRKDAVVEEPRGATPDDDVAMP
jgi:hypothetical protein